MVDPAGRGPRLYFQPVPEGKIAKIRVHLDVQVGADATDQAGRRRLVAEDVARLTAAGGTRPREGPGRGRDPAAGGTRLREQDDAFGYCIVMQDPEGNEFCVA